MYAFKGDRIHVCAERGGTRRDAEVIADDFGDGRPPYWVRWVDSGEEALLFPAPDADVEHAGPGYQPEYDPRPVPAVRA